MPNVMKQQPTIIRPNLLDLIVTVTLAHEPNPDIFGGYWEDPGCDGRVTPVPVETVDQAVAIARAYITQGGLGAGNWTGGQLRYQGVQFAKVAYNGRVFIDDAERHHQDQYLTPFDHCNGRENRVHHLGRVLCVDQFRIVAFPTEEDAAYVCGFLTNQPTDVSIPAITL